MKTKFKLLRGLDNDIMLRIYAIILAILIWFIMSITQYPTVSKTIDNVSVTIPTQGTIASDYSLSPVHFAQDKVSVKIKGMRYEIGNYSANDLEAQLVAKQVNKAGEYDLEIQVVGKNGQKFDVVSVEPKTIKVRFDSIVEKDFPVTAEAPNIRAASGYILSQPTCIPSTVKITGPKQELERIDKVIARTDNDEELTVSESINNTKLVLYSGDTIMDNSLFKFDQQNFSIDIPIYMKKTLPFKLEFQNYPPNFDLSSLKYTLSPNIIDIAAPNALIKDLGEIHLGYMDIRKVDLNSKSEFNISLQSGYQNISGFETVTATFNTSGYSSKIISINKSQIHVINTPAKYDADVQTSGIRNIKLIGPKNIIDKISSADVVAEVDLSNEDLKESTYSLPVNVYCPSYNNVWAYGVFDVTLQVTQKTSAQ